MILTIGFPYLLAIEPSAIPPPQQCQRKTLHRKLLEAVKESKELCRNRQRSQRKGPTILRPQEKHGLNPTSPRRKRPPFVGGGGDCAQRGGDIPL